MRTYDAQEEDLSFDFKRRSQRRCVGPRCLAVEEKPAAPDAEWTRYWSDFLCAEGTGCTTWSFTP